MKAKLLRRIRKNWYIGIEKTNESLFPSKIAVSKKDNTSYYEYPLEDRYKFVNLLLKLSDIGSISRKFIYNRHLDKLSDRYKIREQKKLAYLRLEALNKIRR